MKVCPASIRRTIRGRNSSLSKAIVCENGENYETGCSDSDCLLNHHHSPVTPCASKKSPEAAAMAQVVEGLPLCTDINAMLFSSIPQHVISPVSEAPMKSLSYSLFRRDDHCRSCSSHSLIPFSAPFPKRLGSSGMTTPSETALDVPVGSSMLELLTDFKSATSGAQLGRSRIVRASSPVVVRHSSFHDVRYIMDDWGHLKPRRPIVRVRSMEVFGTTKRDDVSFHPGLVVSPVPRPSDGLVLDVCVSSDHGGKEVLDFMSKRPRPINVQLANAPFLVHPQLIPEHQVSPTLSPWRFSYSRHNRDDLQKAVDISEGSTITPRLSRNCSGTISSEADSIPPTPNSAASVWSQDSAPNSAMFWDMNAWAYASEYL